MAGWPRHRLSEPWLVGLIISQFNNIRRQGQFLIGLGGDLWPSDHTVRHLSPLCHYFSGIGSNGRRQIRSARSSATRSAI